MLDNRGVAGNREAAGVAGRPAWADDAFVDAEDDEGLQRGARALVAALLRAADAPGLFVRWECEIVGLHTMFIRTPSENGFF